MTVMEIVSMMLIWMEICDELDDDIGLDEILSEKTELIKMIDVLGRVHTVHHSGLLLFYIYDNGKVQGVIKK